MSRPVIDLAAIEAATLPAVAEGYRIFQPHRFAESDLDHVVALLRFMEPHEGSCILDAGCGIGEVSRLMHQLRPDLSFVMANISELQLKECPTGDAFIPMLTDCHSIPLRDPHFQGVMFSAALVQMDADVALSEAARVTHQGGVLLVNEMVRKNPGAAQMEPTIGARVLAATELLDAIDAAGWDIDRTAFPPGDDSHFRALLARDNLQHLADTVQPLMVRALRR